MQYSIYIQTPKEIHSKCTSLSNKGGIVKSAFVNIQGFQIKITGFSS